MPSKTMCHNHVQPDSTLATNVVSFPVDHSLLPPVGEDRSYNLADESTIRLIRRLGKKTWLLRYEGEETEIKHKRGMPYIATLLSRPHQPIQASVLAQMDSPTTDYGRSVVTLAEYQEDRGEEYDDLDLPEVFTRQDVIDDKTINDCKATIHSLTKEIEQAEQNRDDGRSHKLQNDREFLTKYLQKALDQTEKSRPLRAGDPEEKARSAVAKAIQRALEHIAEKSPRMAELADSLARKIVCRKKRFEYRPDPRDPTWEVFPTFSTRVTESAKMSA